MNLKIVIMTPDNIFWKKEGDAVVLSTNTGQMGVLPNHAPLLTALDIGVMRIQREGEWIPFALMGGFAVINENRVMVLVNQAESADTISLEETESEYNLAKKRLKQAQGQKQKVEANFLFKRAQARYKMLKKT